MWKRHFCEDLSIPFCDLWSSAYKNHLEQGKNGDEPTLEYFITEELWSSIQTHFEPNDSKSSRKDILQKEIVTKQKELQSLEDELVEINKTNDILLNSYAAAIRKNGPDHMVIAFADVLLDGYLDAGARFLQPHKNMGFFLSGEKECPWKIVQDCITGMWVLSPADA